MASIQIEKLRNIQKLDFEMPKSGVWLLTAANGSGKTSLLACLRRIGNSNAFPIHFPSSLESERLDNFSSAKITYKIEEDEVEYAYGGKRWVPRPRRNSNLLNKFGYPNVVYIGANAERITPRPEDFTPQRVQPAKARIIKITNEIFETEKFNNLKTVSVAAGPNNQAFVLKVSDSPINYHSEKQFSLGELCILKLIKSLDDCSNQSLVLIDELEMALHPRAQIQLYKYLTNISNSKTLTVIFSTHSVSLLKSVPRNRIIFLERNSGGAVTPIVGCFPTYAIGNITLGEERAPDTVLYVEDEVARLIVEALVKLAIRDVFDSSSLFPNIKVVPIGGFWEVVHFLSQHSALLPPGTKSYALLDHDVKAETILKWEQNKSYNCLEIFSKLSKQIDYLPWSPEVGIAMHLSQNRTEAERNLKLDCHDPNISLRQSSVSIESSLEGPELRKMSKSIFKDVCENISTATAKNNDEAKRILCELFAKHYYDENKRKVLSLLGPKLK